MMIGCHAGVIFWKLLMLWFWFWFILRKAHLEHSTDRCDDHTGIFTCDGCARDPYFYVPAETQSYVIKLSCSRKVLATSGD